MGVLRTGLLICLGLFFVLVGVANMTPVTVNLLPEEIGVPEAQLRDVPLAVALLGVGLLGVVAGHLMEWMREARHRREVHDKSVEMSRMRREINRLAARVDTEEARRARVRSAP